MRACVIALILLCSVYCGLVAAQNQDDGDIAPVNNNCGCNQYNCGCCQDLEWRAAYLNETICANATYLKEDYGISVTLTFNGFAVINETISARNPPPICVATEIEELLPIDVCLKLYDIDYTKEHVCFMIIGKIGMVRIPILRLGCLNIAPKHSPGGHWWQRFKMWGSHINHNSVDEPFVTQT